MFLEHLSGIELLFVSGQCQLTSNCELNNLSFRHFGCSSRDLECCPREGSLTHFGPHYSHLRSVPVTQVNHSATIRLSPLYLLQTYTNIHTFDFPLVESVHSHARAPSGRLPDSLKLPKGSRRQHIARISLALPLVYLTQCTLMDSWSTYTIIS